VPWILALTTSPNTIDVLRAAPRQEILYCLVCGMLWGFGGLTWGLMIRYLGVGLGLAMGAGLTSVTGTLIPPMLKGSDAMAAMFHSAGGQVSIAAAAVSLLGIICVGLAGRSKESELSDEAKKKTVAEFDFRKGIMAAIFAGLMSSAMSFGLQGGPHLQQLALSTAPVTAITWAGIPVLVVVLFGGFIVNGGWCIILNFKNRTLGDYANRSTPIAGNLFFASIAGIIWCLQFVCFKTGEPSMGSTSYIGWSVLMASSILFSQLLGILLGEWKGTGGKTRGLLASGLLLLIGSSVLAGYAGSL
jgi:L-rhamnose-H+ transport protein